MLRIATHNAVATIGQGTATSQRPSVRAVDAHWTLGAMTARIDNLVSQYPLPPLADMGKVQLLRELVRMSLEHERPSVSEAARRLGISPNTARGWTHRDAEFRRAVRGI